ncbi:MAG: rhodanese-like domain-containing protein [Sedimentisphaerales bacterium]|nr:rhodanese-like domain-containing protein [Sedimentisphaerales bacterium]HNY79809.1 rhodanese-like domain-containing protein [Sedimentisphaerales bacterium]HOH63146.1 rhodanese-like domain-containing protein [Sedimentisphaerales bacterium]
MRHNECEMSFDGERVFWRWYKWGGVEGTTNFLPREKANYVSMMWDGKAYSNYRTGWSDPNGVLVIDNHPHPMEADGLRYQHLAAPVFGYYFNTNERIDQALRNASSLALRNEMEDVNGSLCHVMEAKTKYGDYTIWLDPSRGHSVAKVEIVMLKSLRHLYRGVPVSGDRTFHMRVLRFEKVDDVWVPFEVDWSSSQTIPGGTYTTSTRVTIADIVLCPDHEAMGSFVRDDVKEGAKGWIVPHDHIKRTWHAGEFVATFDQDVIHGIDATLETMVGEDRAVKTDGATLETENDRSRSSQLTAQRPRRPQPFCGLYCTYAALSLTAQKIDFPELIKAEYFGSSQGSSILELQQAARDFGLSAEPAARLSASGLRNCPYRAILHVRSHPGSPKYDHYELFLGVEKGKAKLFNPPEAPRLVSFADLATQWDGKALFISDKPIDTDLILAADRQRLLRYAMIGVLAILLMHFGKRIWLSVIPPISRRWAMGLTVAEVAMLGLAALLCGGAFHFFRDGGLLANASATQALQKGHAMNFVPKVHEKKVQRLLGSDAIFIDARLASDYERGHLAGAISLPIDANDAMWEQTLAKIPQGQPIVTYCQSAGCKFAEKVSLRLIEEGCTDIALFKGGWAEWVAKHGRPQPAPEPGKEVEAEDADQNDPT